MRLNPHGRRYRTFDTVLPQYRGFRLQRDALSLSPHFAPLLPLPGSIIYLFFHFTLSSRSRSYSPPSSSLVTASRHTAVPLPATSIKLPAPPAAADSRRARDVSTRIRAHTRGAHARAGAARLRVRSAYRWIRMSRR